MTGQVGGAAGDPARARAQEKSTVAARTAPKGGGGDKGGGGGVPLPELKISPDYKENALFFDPSFTYIEAGDRFQTPLFYYNGLEQAVDRVVLWLHYDPEMLEADWIDTSPLEGESGDSLTVKVWPEPGYVQIEGSPASPLGDKITPIAIIHWRAREAIGDTQIKLEAPPGAALLMEAQGQNQIKPTKIGNQSVVNFTIGIGAKGEADPGLRMVNEVRSALPVPPLDRESRARLAIISPRGQDMVGTGEIGTADVLLINPSNVAFDQLQFRIIYDPKQVQILDADEDNYITTGINLFDGDFHEKYPFDLQFANSVSPETGVMTYAVGSASGPRIYPSGTVARIVYRMLRSAGKAAFRFEAVDPATGLRATDLTVMGRSLLGDDITVAREALHGLEIPVRPVDLGGS